MAETPDELANVRVYTEERIEMCAGLKDDSQRGLVEMAVTKHLTALQALLDWQAQSKHLSIYVQIELSERGKQHNAFMRWRRRTISAFNCCESGGTSDDALVMRAEQQPPVIMKNSYR